MSSDFDVNLTYQIDHKQLLENTALAMTELSIIVRRFEASLIDAPQEVPFSEGAFLRAQDLDLISQTVVELGDFLTRLASRTPENLRAPLNEVLGSIRLARVRQILLSGSSALSAKPHNQSHTIQLFE